MFKETKKIFQPETEVLRQGAYIRQLATNPEIAPIYLTTAFNVEDLDELQERYDERGFCYNRNRNPNRSALIELVTHMEGAEDSIICSSGMAAISTTVLALVEKGDHILANEVLYGESLDFFRDVLPNYGVETTFVDFKDIDAVKKAVRNTTKIVYTESISNPLIDIVDLEAVARLAHEKNALFVVDNTFMTAVGCKVLDHGADLVITSLTKFANGHSDAVCGSVSGKKEEIQKIYRLQVLLGSTADAFTSWLVQRGMRTMSLRVEKQMKNALLLAEKLEKSPHVKSVYYPGLASHPQYELAKDLFKDGFGGMLSIVLPDNREKLNEFLRRLSIAHYAMTLGGYRTTIAHPVMSSHYDLPEEERKRLGITFGLLRISAGIENSDDLIADFEAALTVYDE